MIGNRMVELTWQAYKGDYSGILNLCEAMNIKTEFHGNVLNLRGKVPTSIYNGLDPSTIFVCLGFTFFGEYWNEICVDDMKKISELWKDEVKSKKISKINKTLNNLGG